MVIDSDQAAAGIQFLQDLIYKDKVMAQPTPGGTGDLFENGQAAMEAALKRARAEKKDDDATIASLREKLAASESLNEKRAARVAELEAFEKRPRPLPCVASFPIHYERPADRWKYDVVQSIRTLTLLRQPHPEKRLDGEYHFRYRPNCSGLTEVPP